MKAIPLGLLVFAAIVFIFAWRMQQQPDAPWYWGYVRAAAEAGMVGGLADWFAVTALFRRPLGLPIPHTNLIASKKDQLGDSLGEFVQTNFLTEATVRAKVSSAQPALKIGRYLQDSGHRDYLLGEVSHGAQAGLDSLNDEDITLLIRNMVFEQASSFAWGPPAGALLDAVVDDNVHTPAVDALLRVACDWLITNEATIVALVADRGPAQGFGLARSMHEVVGRKVHSELLKWAQASLNDPEHKTRKAIDSWLAQLATELREDPAMIEKVESLKFKLLASDEVHKAVASLWPTTKRVLGEALANPDSELRRRADDIVAQYADRLVTDEVLRARVDARIESGALYLTARYGAEAATLISDTVARWDASEASERIELQVGRDLQFIRINGTVVGALAGVAIYAFANLLI